METKNLDVSKIKVPKGYKVIIDPELIEQERRTKEKVELEEIVKNTPIPSDEELIEYGKMFHPYYELKNRLM